MDVFVYRFTRREFSKVETVFFFPIFQINTVHSDFAGVDMLHLYDTEYPHSFADVRLNRPTPVTTTKYN